MGLWFEAWGTTPALKLCKAIDFLLCAKQCSYPQPLARAEKKIKSENKMVKPFQALGWSSTGPKEAKTQLWDSFISTCKNESHSLNRTKKPLNVHLFQHAYTFWKTRASLVPSKWPHLQTAFYLSLVTPMEMLKHDVFSRNWSRGSLLWANSS